MNSKSRLAAVMAAVVFGGIVAWQQTPKTSAAQQPTGGSAPQARPAPASPKITPGELVIDLHRPGA